MRTFFPTVRIVAVMPQEFPSGEANYTPPRHLEYPNQIWISSELGQSRFVCCLLHEIGHWIIEFLPYSHRLHGLYDRN